MIIKFKFKFLLMFRNLLWLKMKLVAARAF